jgi:hypothetical protein
MSIYSDFTVLMTLTNTKANKVFSGLDAEKNGETDDKASVEDLQKAKGGPAGDLKDIATYILGHLNFAQALGLDLNNLKSTFSLQTIIDAFTQGKFKASADDFNNAANDYDKMNAAMSVISQHKDELDAATHGNVDGHFDISDFYNLSISGTASQDAKAAAAYVNENQGLLRDIDGHIDKTADGVSDGKFGWSEFQNAQKHALDPDYGFRNYANGEAPALNGTIIQDTQQGGVNDCGANSALRALAETDKGKELIRNSITKVYDDGSADVVFAGDSGTTYHVIQADINKMANGTGDKDMQILLAAIDQKIKNHGNPNGIDHIVPDDVYQLIDGGQGRGENLTTPGSTPDSVKEFLLNAAPHIGKDMALTITGAVDANGNWKAGYDHAFQISKIDTNTDMVTYTNPWDSSIQRTISIKDLANQFPTGEVPKDKNGKDTTGGYFSARDYFDPSLSPVMSSPSPSPGGDPINQNSSNNGSG